MTGLFRSLIFFFLFVLAAFVVIDWAVRHRSQPDFTKQMVLDSYGSEIETLKEWTRKSLESEGPVLEVIDSESGLDNVLFAQTEGEAGIRVRYLSPALNDAGSWSMEPTPGGDLPAVGRATVTTETGGNTRSIEAVVLNETVFADADTPLSFSVYLRLPLPEARSNP